eukprot:TRINITY_DN2406_c0_g1_i4.p1 TRINITY_DN2406_c0_g1~~TRINITY_DN2406_c0_g1_i4.p1  ORF type:complete len:445 (+),score=139.89 TRINITY_DN2406_c0_g1_i4:136-1470(+)
MLYKNQVTNLHRETDVLVLATESPWITTLKYSFSDSEFLYLAMEFVQGGDFRGLLNNVGLLHQNIATFYLAEMAVAVNDLHELGYIHRDLKPDNFLIDRTGHIKLVDFGLSKPGVSELEKYSNSNHQFSKRLKRTSSLTSDDMQELSSFRTTNMLEEEGEVVETTQKYKYGHEAHRRMESDDSTSSRRGSRARSNTVPDMPRLHLLVNGTEVTDGDDDDSDEGDDEHGGGKFQSGPPERSPVYWHLSDEEEESSSGRKRANTVEGMVTKTLSNSMDEQSFHLINEKVQAGRRKTPSIVGSLNYMAPETLMGKGTNLSSDWWSLGCIFYEMLTGLPAFTGTSANECRDNVLNWKTSMVEPILVESEQEVLEHPKLGFEPVMTTTAWDLISKLVCAQENRLGNSFFSEIQAHRIFNLIEWDDLREQRAPFVPQLEDELDTVYFGDK